MLVLLVRREVIDFTVFSLAEGAEVRRHSIAVSASINFYF